MLLILKSQKISHFVHQLIQSKKQALVWKKKKKKIKANDPSIGWLIAFSSDCSSLLPISSEAKMLPICNVGHMINLYWEVFIDSSDVGYEYTYLYNWINHSKRKAVLHMLWERFWNGMIKVCLSYLFFSCFFSCPQAAYCKGLRGCLLSVSVSLECWQKSRKTHPLINPRNLCEWIHLPRLFFTFPGLCFHAMLCAISFSLLCWEDTLHAVSF